MKLPPEITAKLVADTDGKPLQSIIDDACELLTIQVVLLLRQRIAILTNDKDALKFGSTARNFACHKINTLNQFIVELSEAE